VNKKYLVILILFILLIKSECLLGGDSNYGLYSGLNFSKYVGSSNISRKFKVGPLFGYFFEKQISNSTYFNPGFMLSWKGTIEEYYHWPNSAPITYNYSKAFIEIPIMFRFYPLQTDRLKPFMNYGIYMGFELSHDRENLSNQTTYDPNAIASTDAFELGFLMGYGVVFPVKEYKFGIEGRFSRSFMTEYGRYGHQGGSKSSVYSIIVSIIFKDDKFNFK